MGLHTGEPTPLEDDYVGMDVHRAARLAASAHGGQVVVSGATAQLLGEIVSGVRLKDLGWHRLKDIPEPEHIFQLVVDDLEQGFPPLKSLGTPTNLPPSPTPIIGRDGELAEIAAQFSRAGVRLVTLTGPGGSGKTRLAIAAAGLLGPSRADGVYFVALATASTADVMWSTIAESLGIPGEGRAPPTFFEHLRQRDLLLILDNLEQVTDASLVVSDLLAHAPQVAIIATSRRPLHVTGEYQHPVPPLEIPTRVEIGQRGWVVGCGGPLCAPCADGSTGIPLDRRQRRRCRGHLRTARWDAAGDRAGRSAGEAARAAGHPRQARPQP